MTLGNGKRKLSKMPSSADGSRQQNMRKSLASRMSDEEIARLSDPELVELMQRILEEIEIRMMQKD